MGLVGPVAPARVVEVVGTTVLGADTDDLDARSSLVDAVEDWAARPQELRLSAINPARAIGATMRLGATRLLVPARAA
jgi:hypothetical protein